MSSTARKELRTVKWYGVFVPENIAIALVRFCNIHGILSDRDGEAVWYKARECECEMIVRFLERR